MDQAYIIAIAGGSGSGKTYLAMAKAVAALQAKKVNRIILTRPAVEAGESLGYLPGDMYAKVNPYLRPLYDALYDMVEPHLIKDYLDLIDKLEKEGISFLDSKDSISNNVNHYQKLEKLEWNIDQDIPIPNGLRHTRRSFERYMKDKHFFEEKYYGTEIIAIKNNQYIGMTSLSIYHKSEPFKAWTETLGVLKQFRRQGVATALKIKAIQNLLDKGITEVRTDNELNNPMYKINESLGFHAQPSSLEYLKTIN